jgi:sigma-B regulation protein RsbU (phosphoserine phosphatase)
MFPNSRYEESVLRLTPGDLLIAYTDGVVEATNPEGEEWGVPGLLNAAAARPPRCPAGAEAQVERIFDSMDRFSHGCQTDDATVAVLRVV